MSASARTTVVETAQGTELRCVRTGKKCFASPAKAAQSARTIRRCSEERMHAYHCDDCRKWHLGHAE